MKQYKESIIKIIRKHLPVADIYSLGAGNKRNNDNSKLLKSIMEVAKKRLQKLVAALSMLKLALKYYKKDPENFLHSDPKIKRFEYASDQFWNFLKTFLLEKHSIEVKSPRETYRKSFTVNMITEDETQKLIQMQLTRNNTVHLYSEEFTKRILPEIDGYYELMHDITERLKKQL